MEVHLDDESTPPRAVLSRTEGADAAEVAVHAAARFPGHHLVVRDDDELASAFGDLGLRLARASSLLVLDLPAEIDVDTSASLGPLLAQHAEAYAAATLRAYPPGHPDHEDADLTAATATICSYLDGRVVGAFLADASAEARSEDGTLLGAIFVNEYPREGAFDGGPWVTDIFVEPAAQGRGVGRALLRHAATALAESGRPTLGLAVTDGTPARHLYDAVGFVERSRSWVFSEG